MLKITWRTPPSITAGNDLRHVFNLFLCHFPSLKLCIHCSFNKIKFHMILVDKTYCTKTQLLSEYLSIKLMTISLKKVGS